jgi:hypothetical protein
MITSPPRSSVVGKNTRDLAYALQRTKLDCERRLVAQQRDYQAGWGGHTILSRARIQNIFTDVRCCVMIVDSKFKLTRPGFAICSN